MKEQALRHSCEDVKYETASSLQDGKKIRLLEISGQSALQHRGQAKTFRGKIRATKNRAALSYGTSQLCLSLTKKISTSTPL